MDHRKYIPEVVSLAWFIAHVYGENTEEAVMRCVRNLLNDLSLPLDARDVLVGLLHAHQYEIPAYIENFKILAGVAKPGYTKHSVGVGKRVIDTPLKTGLKQNKFKLITVG